MANRLILASNISSDYDPQNDYLGNEFKSDKANRIKIAEPVYYKIIRGFGSFLNSICCSYGIINVERDHHMFLSEYGIFTECLGPGLHIINHCVQKHEIVKDKTIGELSYGILTRDNKFVTLVGPGLYFPNSLLNEELIIKPIVIIKQNEHGFETSFGKYVRTVGPGIYKPNTFLDEKIVVKKDFVVPENFHGIFTVFNKFDSLLGPGVYRPNEFLEESIFVIEDIAVKENHHGMLTQYGKFVKVLLPGTYCANTIVGEKIDVIEDVIIRETHRGVKLIDGKFDSVLNPGKYVINPYLKERIDDLPEITIEDGFRGLFFVDGICKNILEPGKYFANPHKMEKIVSVSMKTLTIELLPVSVLTADTTTIVVKGILVYHVIDPFVAHCKVDNIDHAIREQIKTITNQVFSEHELDHITTHKKELSNVIKERVSQNSSEWGVYVEAIDFKEIEIPHDIQKVMTAKTTATREAEAMIIRGRAEVENARNQQQVAEMLSSHASQHIRETELMKEFAKNPNSKFVFVTDSVHSLINGRSLGDMTKNFIQE